MNREEEFINLIKNIYDLCFQSDCKVELIDTNNLNPKYPEYCLKIKNTLNKSESKNGKQEEEDIDSFFG